MRVLILLTFSARRTEVNLFPKATGKVSERQDQIKLEKLPGVHGESLFNCCSMSLSLRTLLWPVRSFVLLQCDVAILTRLTSSNH